MLEFVRGRGWRLAAVVVGVLALFLGGWLTATFDIGGVSGLAIAVGLAGIATLVLIPRTNPQRRRWPTRETDASMQVLRIDHVQLAMPAGGEHDATAFYEGLLGLRRVPKPPHLEVRGGCWFVADEVQLHLGVEADFRPARKAHPALVVSGLAELVGALRDDGATVYTDQPLPGFDRVYVDDPFGNRIELLEPL